MDCFHSVNSLYQSHLEEDYGLSSAGCQNLPIDQFSSIINIIDLMVLFAYVGHIERSV